MPGGQLSPACYNWGMSDKERALVNRGDDPYPNDIKAEAVAPVYESGNFTEAAREMEKRYPERHPSRQLITRWFNQVDPAGLAALSTERKEAFESGVMELADKAQGKLYDALDDMSPTQVPIPAGIAIDKGLKLLEIEKRAGGGGNTVNILALVEQRQARMTPEEQDILEGTARLAPADLDALEGTVRRPRRLPPKGP